MKKYSLLIPAIVLLLSAVGCSSPEDKAAKYLANADQLFLDNNLDKAVIEYRNVLQINQNSPDAWYGLARIYERKQEPREVYKALTRIRDTNPNHIKGRILLAQLLLAMNEMDRALEDANHLMELAPQDERVHSLMATVQLRLGNLEAAHESVKQALALDPDSHEAILVKAFLQLAENNYDQAISTLDTALKTQPENSSLYLMKIQAFTEMGDESASLDVLKTLVQQFPENTEFKHALVRRYAQMGDIDQAEQLLEQIVEDHPERIEAKKQLAGFTNQYRSADEAITLLTNYIEQDQEAYELRFFLAELTLSHKGIDEGINVYQGIITDDGVQPNGLEARNKLALIHLRAGKSDEARALVDEVLANAQNNENALVLQAGFRIVKAQYDDAIVDLRTVLRVRPKSTKALALMGDAYTALGSVELAYEAYGKAFILSPETVSIANAYAKNLMQQNKLAQADEVLLESMRQGNKSIQTIKLMTQVKLMLGEWDIAEKLAQHLKNVEGEEAVFEQVLGLVYQGREQADKSINAFKRAHKLAPDADQPVVALVQTLVRNNKVEEARRFMQVIVSENENNSTATLLLGQLSLLEKDIPTAIEHFNRVVQINPKLETGYRSLASIYARQGKLDAAESIMTDGLAQIPGSTAIAVNLASIYERQQKYDKAINVFEELLQKDPGLIIAKNNLANLLIDHRDDLENYIRARQLASGFRNSKVPQFRDTYAWASVKTRSNLEGAVAILEEIIKEYENVGLYHYHLGEALRIMGDADNARIHLSKAIELEKADSRLAAQATASLQLILQ